MPLKDTVSFELPSRPEWLPVLGAAAEKYAEKIGFPQQDVQRICLALEEAALYTIDFGYGTSDETLSVNLSRTALGVQASIRSKGIPLEEEMLPQFDPDRFRTDGDTTGLSSFLIRNLVDTARFSTFGDEEREITLRKSFPQSDHKPTHSDSPVQNTPREKSVAFTVRAARPDDADGISRLALRSHGAVFFNEQIYYPERVREMLEQEEMVSIVAETTEGDLIGHGALVAISQGLRAEELTYGFTDERFRGRGCISDIADSLLKNATARGVHALCSLAVTNHVHSQRAAHHLGLKDCVLLLAASPASRSWREDQQEPARIANIGMLRYLGTVDDAPLYAPKRHRDMIERICRHLGTKRRFMEPSRRSLPGSESLIEAVSDFKEGWGSIMIQRYGKDIVRQVGEQLRVLCSQGIPIIDLSLPLENPFTFFMNEEFEDLGFFFAGIGPGLDGLENLVLQYVNNVDPGYDSIRIHEPFGRELLAYVRSCDPCS